jgi:hypothetical protein
LLALMHDQRARIGALAQGRSLRANRGGDGGEGSSGEHQGVADIVKAQAAPDVDRNGPAGHHPPQARASSRLGALQPIVRAEFRREVAIAYDQARVVARTEPQRSQSIGPTAEGKSPRA